MHFLSRLRLRSFMDQVIEVVLQLKKKCVQISRQDQMFVSSLDHGIYFEDIIGCDQAKHAFEDAVIYPLQYAYLVCLSIIWAF